MPLIKIRGNFVADQFTAVNHTKESRELTENITADKTLDAADSGKLFYVTVDAKTITLPATALGLTYTIVNGLPAGQTIVTISPNASDKISGADLTAADNKDLINTKATARYGDKVVLFADGADGWFIQKMTGTWARQA